MGNAASNKVPGPAPLEIPDLIRQSSKSRLEDCSICLEPHRKGILCSTKEHFICQDCFAPYVSSVVEDAGKMQDSGFTIQCCYPNCAAQPWSSHEARLALDGAPKVLDQYVDALVNQLKLHSRQDALAQADMAEESVDRGLRGIVDALTLGCPFCHVALDPTPDGCAAMRCYSCSKYFCFLCFNIQRDNTACHAHVRECPSNPSQNVFPPQKLRDAAQKQLRVEAVRRVLSSAYGLHWRQHAHTAVLLEQAKAVLRDSFISPAEVLGGVDVAALADGGGTQLNSALMFLSGFMVAVMLMEVRQWGGSGGTNMSSSIADQPELEQENRNSTGGILLWIFSSISWLLKRGFVGFCYVCLVVGIVDATPELSRLSEPSRIGFVIIGIFICFHMSLFELCWYIICFVVQLCLALLKLVMPCAIIGVLAWYFSFMKQ